MLKKIKNLIIKEDGKRITGKGIFWELIAVLVVVILAKYHAEIIHLFKKVKYTFSYLNINNLYILLSRAV